MQRIVRPSEIDLMMVAYSECGKTQVINHCDKGKDAANVRAVFACRKTVSEQRYAAAAVNLGWMHLSEPVRP